MALEKPLLSSYQPNGLQSLLFGKLNTNPVSQCYVTSISAMILATTQPTPFCEMVTFQMVILIVLDLVKPYYEKVIQTGCFRHACFRLKVESNFISLKTNFYQSFSLKANDVHSQHEECFSQCL